jgi:hypothetical protein
MPTAWKRWAGIDAWWRTHHSWKWIARCPCPS